VKRAEMAVVRRGTIAGAVAAVIAIVMSLMVVSHERVRCSPWSEGTRRGGMVLTYAGYGTAQVCGQGRSREWRLAPRAASAPSETHAALARTVGEHGDLTLQVRFRTVRRLRKPRPQSWEAAWVIWHYSDDRHFYSLVLKPTGWELGKEDPAYPGAQRFLATDSSPRFDVKEWHTARITQTGDRIAVKVDDRDLTRFRDRERPYGRGHVGLYTEDAAVRFTDLRIT
jgi:Domain of Unknown Function (DUF1080)